MVKYGVLFALFLVSPFVLRAAFIHGEVVDSSSGEGLIGALIKSGDRGVVTDNYGSFQLYTDSRPGESVTLEVSYLGYTLLRVEAFVGQRLVVQLVAGVDLPSVVVRSGMGPTGISSLSSLNPSLMLLNRIPAVGGERDPVKALQIFPGVSAGIEGTADLHIRGGTPDQNLLLLDGATVYNANHLFGFLSPFQPSIIKDIKLYKGGFPAEYGGRLSGIIDITTDEGNKKEWERDLSVGLINSSFKLSGPIYKDKLSLSLGGRLSYLTMLTLLSPSSGVQQNWFYDFNIKMNYKSERSNFSAAFFSNYDRSGIREDFMESPSESNIRYGNLTGSVRWFYALSPSTSIVSTGAVTRYDYVSIQALFSDSGTLLNGVRNGSFINEQLVKTELRHHFGASLNLVFGGEFRNRRILPSTTNLSSIAPPSLEFSTVGQDVALFTEFALKVSNVLSLTAGLRVQSYWLSNDQPAQTYPEPRLRLTYAPAKRLEIFASYSRMSQSLHLLTSNLIGIPTNSWVMANGEAPPSISDNYSFGTSSNLGKFKLEVEVFRKLSSGIVDPLPGISLFQNTVVDWTSRVSTGGENEVHGLELLLNLAEDDFFGWLAYTLSWNTIQYDDVNGGKRYFRQFDRRHELNFLTGKELGKGWRATANFTYGSGLRMTLPVAAYFDAFTQTVIPVYTGRYQQRVPPSHRLDIGFEHQVGQPGERMRTWALGCYNVYARRNPTFVFAEEDITNTANPEISISARSFSPFTFIPYLSYSLSW